jgi:hypothetical protein
MDITSAEEEMGYDVIEMLHLIDGVLMMCLLIGSIGMEIR